MTQGAGEAGSLRRQRVIAGKGGRGGGNGDQGGRAQEQSAQHHADLAQSRDDNAMNDQATHWACTLWPEDNTEWRAVALPAIQIPGKGA